MGVARSSFLFAVGTFLSRLSGLLRDIIVASVFGATNLLDAFWVANRIPNLFRDMLAEGALGSSFTKVYTSLSETDPERAKRLAANALWLGFLLTLLVCGLGVVFAPQFVYLFTFMSKESARGADFVPQTIGLTRLLFPTLGFAILAAIASGVLYQRGRFLFSSSVSISLNLGYIIGALVFAPLLIFWEQPWIQHYFAAPSITGLALGVILGAFLQFFLQFLVVGSERPRAPFWNEDVKRVLIIMGPAAVAASTPLINLIINTNFATMLEEGSVTWLNYAFRLLHFPVAIFGVAVGAVALPTLTKAIARADGQVNADVTEDLQNSIELVLWLMVPCCVVLMKDSLPLSQVVFQHGRYDAEATLRTAECLFAYSFSVVPYGIIKVFTSFYFATERTKFAMKVSLWSILINFLANYLLIDTYRHAGLAAASACTVGFNALVLSIGLRGSGVKLVWPKLLNGLKYLMFATALFLALIFATDGLTKDWHPILQLLVDGILVVLIYFTFALYRLNWSLKYAFGVFKKIRR